MNQQTVFHNQYIFSQQITIRTYKTYIAYHWFITMANESELRFDYDNKIKYTTLTAKILGMHSLHEAVFKMSVVTNCQISKLGISMTHLAF